MKSPLVSIIVPTYRQSKYLPACLDSLWFQEYPLLEIIVVNDGSPDDTAAVLDRYRTEVAGDVASFASRYDAGQDLIARTRHPRYPKAGRTLKILTHHENKGLAAALNTGFKACGGRYCSYVPSDDICYPHMIATLVRVLEAENADFAYADMFIHDENGRICRRFSLPDYTFDRCFCDWYLCGVAKLYRRELHERFGYYDETLLAHDHALFMKFAAGGARFIHVPHVLMSLLSHEGERQVHIHSEKNWDRLLEESKRLVSIARSLKSGQPDR